MAQPTESDSSVISQLPINERIEWLIAREHRFAASYQSAESYLARNLYHAKHPTAVLALKCMDGRLNLALATNTPVDIIEPFRSIGGRFDLGWPYFGEMMSVEIQQMTKQGRRTLILINYHYSKGDRLRGCAGWNYDTDLARAGAVVAAIGLVTLATGNLAIAFGGGILLNAIIVRLLWRSASRKAAQGVSV